MSTPKYARTAAFSGRASTPRRSHSTTADESRVAISLATSATGSATSRLSHRATKPTTRPDRSKTPAPANASGTLASSTYSRTSRSAHRLTMRPPIIAGVETKPPSSRRATTSTHAPWSESDAEKDGARGDTTRAMRNATTG